MNKSTLKLVNHPRLHVAILLDGNGRWAASRGLPRSEGHRAGVEAVRRIVRAAPALGIGTLTLYAFSSDNWGRPQTEVSSLLALLEAFFRNDAARCAAEGIRLRVIGRRDRIPLSLSQAIDAAERTTASGALSRTAYRHRLLRARRDSPRLLLDALQPRNIAARIRQALGRSDAHLRPRSGC